jgi:hypothetical protein
VGGPRRTSSNTSARNSTLQVTPRVSSAFGELVLDNHR